MIYFKENQLKALSADTQNVPRGGYGTYIQVSFNFKTRSLSWMLHFDPTLQKRVFYRDNNVVDIAIIKQEMSVSVLKAFLLKEITQNCTNKKLYSLFQEQIAEE